ELGHEPFRVRVPAEGQDGQSQPGRPAFGPLVQHGHYRVGQRDPGGSQELAGLVLGEAQLRGADLGQLPGQPELVQAQREVAAGGHMAWTPGGRLVSSAVSWSAASAELSSCRSSMIRTIGPPDAVSSDRTLSTMAGPLNPDAA